MSNDKVYVLTVWSTDSYHDFSMNTKVFRTEVAAMKYVETYLELEWKEDGFGGQYKDAYTLTQQEIL